MKLLKFYADWCMPCKQQTKELENFDACEIEHINVEENQELTDKYQVQALPTLILVDGDKEIKRFIGMTKRNILEEFITKPTTNGN